MPRPSDKNKKSVATSSTESQTAEPNFETSFARLEALVGAMEGEDLPLEQLLAHHEEGTSLLKRCHSLLEAAQKRIAEVRLGDDSTAASPPEAKKSTSRPSGNSSSSASRSDSDDISLF